MVRLGRRSKDGRFYVVLSVDGQRERAKIADSGSAPEWNESFCFEAHQFSVLKLDICAHRKFKDTHIGGIVESIIALWPSVLDGGNRDFTETISEGTSARVEVHLEIKIESSQTEMANIRRSAEDVLFNMQSPTKPIALAIRASAAALEPGKEFVDNSTPLLNKVKIFYDLMDGIAEVHPYAKMAWSIISIPQKMDRDDRMHSLFATMNSFYNIVSDLENEPEMRHTLQDLLQLAKQTTECLYFIRDYAKTKSFREHDLTSNTILLANALLTVKRTGQQLFATTDDKIDAYCTVFVKFKEELYSRVAVQTMIAAKKTEIVVTHILDNLVATTDVNLDDIPYANVANFDESKGCLPGTRVDILEEIANWINKEDAPRTLLLSGAAGTGKSAIAHTIAHRFKNMNRLGSSFYFVRSQIDRGPGKLFPTVARDLADFNKGIRHALHEVVKDNKALRVTSKITQQFNNLILQPVARPTMTGPLVIVIDALDESGDAQAREDLLRELASKTKALPSNFRILITFRPEPDIMRAFQACDHMASTRNAGARSSPDAKGYSSGHLSLVNSSKVWGCQDPTLGNDTSFLSRSGGSLVMVRFKRVMALVLTAFEPLSVESLNQILHAANDGNAGFKTNVILDYMGSLLSGVTGNDAIRPLHTSFRDFLLDRSRSVDFYIDTSKTHVDFTVASLYILKKELRFNICHLESSHVANKDMPGLADRMKEYVEVILSDKFLFWLEVMSLLEAVPGAAQATHFLVKWSSCLDSGQISEMAIGAHAFVNAFGFPMAQSTPHIYLSALPFAPQSSTVFKRFGKDFLHVLKVSAGANNHWPAAQHIIYTRDVVECLAISPDGSCIASGSYESTIWVWDATTGAALGDPLKGHRDSVRSVAFSPDGSRIVSGSDDKTIRVWDAATGAAVGDPFEGHTNSVNSVAFSPDGLRIVSGSDDNTIRVWNAATGAAVGDPFQGHTQSVNSVACSPDGSQIVSGSYDSTIQMWDAVTCGAMGDPIEGHTNLVNSVAFSPDGARIMSGSGDKTIRVWDVATHATIGDFLEGHTDWVISVAFSPDGKRIVSGSRDKTIRVWDVNTRAAVGNPLDGHADLVRSVAFSPDGSRIVSGSADCTIRVWDTATGAPVGDPLVGHTNWVHSVTFSPDGSRIVSGSSDSTLRVWNATIVRPAPIYKVETSSTLSTISSMHPTSILISPHLEHALHLDVLYESAPGSQGDYRTYRHTDSDGWIVGPASELLFWVPAAYRNKLWPGSRLKIVAGRDYMQLNLSQFVHGNSWQQCYHPSQPP
ncbi:hypothetical protein HETIRDRAFT_446239 [Heterobasidion irregulare TC 32-1]|uniref:NACHT domain-containing protein n=1 Tax=Heterobasidion irregulare (strain TC 32-1) TaxID=747525 RepID=W4JUK6_HETIT|nr:uncharacterized protein HETIRDRAFT_446239 [Heterobasidion irregulare TC 32-1]ETW77154.1 hypothetical protein HETIRDRAFT_446239 [Heterobasidion irregulare TC 32-1]